MLKAISVWLSFTSSSMTYEHIRVHYTIHKKYQSMRNIMVWFN